MSRDEARAGIPSSGDRPKQTGVPPRQLDQAAEKPRTRIAARAAEAGLKRASEPEVKMAARSDAGSELISDMKHTDAAPANIPRPATRPPIGLRPEKKQDSEAGSAADSGAGTQQNPHIATEEQAERFLQFKGKVLTHSSEFTDWHRNCVAILDDGNVLIAASERGNPMAAAAINAARMRKAELRSFYLVDLATLRKVYENHRKIHGDLAVSAEDPAQMQVEFLEIISAAAEAKASDVHFTVGAHECMVKIRVNNDMRAFRQLRADVAHSMLAAAYTLCDASEATYQVTEIQEGRIIKKLPPSLQSLRMQYSPLLQGGRLLVSRLLYTQSSSSNTDIDVLGYAPQQLRDIKLMRRRPYGINVISGPTGSGKSTTLQKALIALMKEKQYKISLITIEDPPEYIIDGAAQLPIIGAKDEKSRLEKFQAAINSVLRSDPNVIMIGEVRDPASAKLAFTASMTGHQVWCSLHTNNALSIIDRFIDMGVETYKWSDHYLLTGLVGQRLIKRLCDACKMPLTDVLDFNDPRLFDPDLLEELKELVPEYIDRIYCVNPSGCKKCDAGYSGRTVAAETVCPDAGFMDAYKQQGKLAAEQYWLDNLNGLTMLEHAVQKMLAGEVAPTDIQEVGILAHFNMARKPRVIDDFVKAMTN